MTTAILEEAPPAVSTDEPTPVPGAEARWAEHVRLIKEDPSMTEAEKAWYCDKTIATAPQLAAMFGYWKSDPVTGEPTPHGDRIHIYRSNITRPKPHPMTWLEHDVMGVVRRNVPGWYIGRARLFGMLRGSHVSDPENEQMIPGMLTLDEATDRFTVVKAPSRHGRARMFKPRRTTVPRKHQGKQPRKQPGKQQGEGQAE